MKKNIVKNNITITNVLKIFDKTNNPIVFIINKKNKLIGSVTDGDIRRAILRDINFNNLAVTICNKKPKYIEYKKNLDIKKIIKVFDKYSLKFLPVIKTYQKRSSYSVLSRIKNRF